jgi:hypothetical protein
MLRRIVTLFDFLIFLGITGFIVLFYTILYLLIF